MQTTVLVVNVFVVVVAPVLLLPGTASAPAEKAAPACLRRYST